MKKIYLDRLRLQASVGILEHELASKQPLEVSIEVVLFDGSIVPARDAVSDVFDYRNLRDAALTEANQGHVNMLETLAGRIVRRLLAHKPVQSVRVRVDKPSIFIDCDSVAVEVFSQQENGDPN
ncbi:MAG: dihydroneopterin aldolase [Burkholderiales bacterium]